MIAIVDYGMGNLRNVQKAVERAGGQALITDDPTVLKAARSIILPGVGAFGDAMQNLRERRLIAPLREESAKGKPLLGICLGMQLLFEESEEMGVHPGLGLLPGRVVHLASLMKEHPAWEPSPLRVPHIGWNQLHIHRLAPLLAGIPDRSYAYFAHSYCVLPTDRSIVLTTTDYGVEFVSMIGCGNLFGVQFHPEKSQEVGRRVLSNFVHLSEAWGGSQR
ncbi:MAG: imidazole glycerol phosphate synthase subunit HisH [Anaerolineae bacterium]|nr:imidazole glycerol phosphate synthase subunit HisH [Anaerolineae bacterium]MDW8069291.1 imidazole glycerol phosphate synthase subunit HisH [Anaerolineae bacterium]